MLPVLFHLMWQRQLAADLTAGRWACRLSCTQAGPVSGARRRQVGIGDRILAGGGPSVVISVSGTRVRLADETGGVRTVTAAELATDPRFEIAAAGSPRGPRPEIGLEGLPADAVEEASWWEAHIAEVVYGLPPDAPAGHGRGRSTIPSGPA